jgi:hypothetical protein
MKGKSPSFSGSSDQRKFEEAKNSMKDAHGYVDQREMDMKNRIKKNTHTHRQDQTNLHEKKCRIRSR